MPLVALHKVSKSFGRHVVLDGVDLAVETGEIVAVIGRSGSGKSTLLRCVNGLESIEAGEITVNGRKVVRTTGALRALHREVGIVFQSYNLFPHLTVERNVTLGPMVGKACRKPARSSSPARRWRWSTSPTSSPTIRRGSRAASNSGSRLRVRSP